ncbi:MAG: ATP-dependent Clp protease proteolytic subunit [Brevundimonas sp.]|uniref:ATP-dependent Clp protease proteolytic subunit n=1 Tax=Brevundimonas sp. TaxID=1871086 RepID=UPI00391BF922
MWLPVLLAVLGTPDVAPPDREAAVIAACASWNAGREAGAPPQTHRVEPDGLCFAGDIRSESSAAFVETLSGFDPDTPLVVVLTSEGGEVNAGMAMGEALVPYTATVVAHRVCASSCGNYLFTAGDRRVIDDDALLLFHGGARLIDEAELREMIAPEVPADQLDAQVAGVLADLEMQIGRQDAFLERAGVDVDLFRWMAGFNDLPEEAFFALCPVRDPRMILYSDRLLAEHGVVVHENRGPQSDAAVAAGVAALGRPGAACFMD